MLAGHWLEQRTGPGPQLSALAGRGGQLGAWAPLRLSASRSSRGQPHPARASVLPACQALALLPIPGCAGLSPLIPVVCWLLLPSLECPGAGLPEDGVNWGLGPPTSEQASRLLHSLSAVSFVIGMILVYKSKDQMFLKRANTQCL